MKKLSLIIFCICCLLAGHVVAQKKLAKPKKKNGKPKSSQITEPLACDLPPNVDRLVIDRSELFLNCPVSVESCSTTSIVEVQAIASDPDNKNDYVYTISGGKIIGSGYNVKWDLTGQPVGSYTITAGVNVGKWGVLGMTQTKTVRISENPLIGFKPSSEPTSWIFQTSVRERPRQNKPKLPENDPANVIDLSLDKEQLVLGCNKTESGNESCIKGVETITISTEAFDKDGDVLVYSYTVSAGRIIGQGAKVIWDLTGIKPGEYKITVAVDDGCGFCGKTMTKTVKVVECADCKSQ